jgi:hypothetical protein
VARSWVPVVLLAGVLACSTGSSSRVAPTALAPAPAEKEATPLAGAVPTATAEEPKPPPPPKKPGAYANTDPEDDFVVGPPEPIADCEEQLEKAGVKFAKATLPVHKEGKKVKITCGAPQVVTYLRGPAKIAYNSPPLLTCGMALALAHWEKMVDREAERIFGSKVVHIEHIGTYSCREIAAYPGWVSEHSYANAIDVGFFRLKNGKTIDVYRDFDIGEDEPKKPGGQFLRVVSRRANDEDVFSHVLTPFFNATHRNHFHLDLARYRADGTRPQ